MSRHGPYNRLMTEIASRELHNNTRALLDRVAAGERIVITVHGRPRAQLVPVDHRPRWMPRERLMREVLLHQADPALADELASLVDETTDDLPWR